METCLLKCDSKLFTFHTSLLTSGHLEKRTNVNFFYIKKKNTGVKIFILTPVHIKITARNDLHKILKAVLIYI